MALKPVKLATIHSFVDQLCHSDDTVLRRNAALALGSLERFIPKDANAVQVAAELGIFDALLEVLMDVNDHPDVHEACLVALAQLVAPAPGPDADRAWPHLRKAVNSHIMNPEVLGELAFHATSSTSSRSLMGLARIVCGIGRFTNTSNEGLVLNAGLLGALVGAIGHAPRPRDNAVAALAALQLAASSPGLFKAAVRKPLPRAGARQAEDDGGFEGLGQEFTEEDMGAGGVPTYGMDGGVARSEPVTLFTELTKLYASSIAPGQLGPEALPLPSDAAALLLSALALQPKGLSGTAPRKAILRRCLEAGAPACLVSYVVVECGALTAAAAALAESAAAVLEQSASTASLDVSEMRERMARIRTQVDDMHQELADMQELGRSEEPHALDVAEAKDMLKDEYRSLRRSAASLEAQAAITSHSAAALRAWVARNARPSGRVRRTAPSVPVLRQVVGALGALGTAPQQGADVDPDLEAEAIAEACGASMLASGLLPAALRLAATADAVGTVVSELGGVVAGLKVAEQLGDLLGGALRLLESDAAHVQRLSGRVETRLKGLRDEAGRVRKAITYGTARGTARSHTPLTEHNTLSPGIWPADLQERALELAGEERALVMAQLDLGAMAGELAGHISRVGAAEQELLAAAERAARALPAPPSTASKAASLGAPSQQGGGHSSPSSAAAQHSPPGTAVAPPATSSPSALLDPNHPAASLVPLLASHLKKLARPRNNLAALLAVMQGGDAHSATANTGASSGLLSPSSSFASLSLASPRTSSPGTRGGRPRSAKAGGSPTRPSSAPPAGTTKAQHKNKLAIESNYTNVVFTQSPMRGCPPKGMRPRAPPTLFIAQGALGPELQAVALLDEVEEVVWGIRESVLLLPTGSVSGAPESDGEMDTRAPHLSSQDVGGLPVVMEEEEEEGGLDGGRDGAVSERRPGLVVDAMVKQAAELAGVLSCLASLASECTRLARAARLLPAGTGLKFGRLAPEQLRPLMADLMRAFASALQHPADCQAVAAAVAEVASVGATQGRREYEGVYIKTGVVEALVDLLDGRRRQQASQDAEGATGCQDDSSGAAPARPGSASPQKGQKTSPGAPALSKGRTQSRYDLAPPVMRPNAVTVAEQAAAAAALTAIGAHHPEALTAVSQDPGALGSMCDLCNDHSCDPMCRLAAATLLAKMLTVGSSGSGDGSGNTSSGGGSAAGGGRRAATQGLAQAAIARGAFSALMGIMDSDHRQGSGGAKDAVVVALAAVAADDDLREAVVSAAEAGQGGSGHGGGEQLQHVAAGATPTLKSGDDVVRWVLKVLWGVPLQLYQLMSSDRTKKGKTVDPKVVKPLSDLAAVACQQLSGLALGDRAAKSMLKGMGVGSKINITFLQAIKDPGLHGALIELRGTVN